MSAAYVDTSCLVAVAFKEPGFEAIVTRLQGFQSLYSSNLLEAEFRAALTRRGATDDGSVAAGMAWVLPGRALSSEIGTVLAAGYIRGADLWHLACALYLSPDPRELPFMTLDEHQAWVASCLGFPTMQMDAPASR